jgi:hypothetical protein
MTEAAPASAATTSDPAQAKPPAEWKPEPRTWTWKDLFTAPMLAFKPKCMAVSAATLLLIGVIAWGLHSITTSYSLGDWYYPVYAGFVLLALVVFGLGATLVAVFMKADLLDDEFLSFGEALAQYKGRILPAIMVPLFLAILVVVVHGLAVWFPVFIASIPYAGGLIYGLLYPLGFAAAVFAVLLAVAVALSIFVFPAIVAVRRHGWFDNVVDTIEAVGTRPHILVASLLLTFILAMVTQAVADGARDYLRGVSTTMPAWGDSSGRSDPQRVEERARQISDRALIWIDPSNATRSLSPVRNPWNVRDSYAAGYASQDSGFYQWGSGLIGGFWQTVIGALVFGYCLNLFIGGGLLTYLLVREDDYWDDEDLEDLDKLAKELEEEAKREESTQAAAAPAAPVVPAPEPPQPTSER